MKKQFIYLLSIVFIAGSSIMSCSDNSSEADSGIKYSSIENIQSTQSDAGHVPKEATSGVSQGDSQNVHEDSQNISTEKVDDPIEDVAIYAEVNSVEDSQTDIPANDDIPGVETEGKVHLPSETEHGISLSSAASADECSQDDYEILFDSPMVQTDVFVSSPNLSEPAYFVMKSMDDLQSLKMFMAGVSEWSPDVDIMIVEWMHSNHIDDFYAKFEQVDFEHHNVIFAGCINPSNSFSFSVENVCTNSLELALTYCGDYYDDGLGHASIAVIVPKSVDHIQYKGVHSTGLACNMSDEPVDLGEETHVNQDECQKDNFELLFDSPTIISSVFYGAAEFGKPAYFIMNSLEDLQQLKLFMLGETEWSSDVDIQMDALISSNDAMKDFYTKIESVDFNQNNIIFAGGINPSGSFALSVENVCTQTLELALTYCGSYFTDDLGDASIAVIVPKSVTDIQYNGIHTTGPCY